MLLRLEKTQDISEGVNVSNITSVKQLLVQQSLSHLRYHVTAGNCSICSVMNLGGIVAFMILCYCWEL
jgi:hypothetical protein